MRLLRSLLAAAAACAAMGGAHAATGSIHLGSYSLSATHDLDVLGGRGLEASAVTYARDRGTLFFVGDEGLGVVEISTTGQTLGTMAFDWSGTGSSNRDAEGLAYLGNGRFVVIDERLQDGFRFDYVAGATAALQNAPTVSFGDNAGNLGTEGIAVDPLTGRFVTVKQNSPQQVLEGTLSFGPAGSSGTSTMAPLFDAASLGLASLSDVAIVGDNLLILSLDSMKLVEVTRSGQVLSSLDLTAFTDRAVEGVTIDENGTIYLVAENAGALPSQLYVLTAPVPEPGSLALMLAGGLGLAAWQRKKQR